MINRLVAKFVNKSDARGQKALKHIIYSAGLKAINAAISFLIIPLYLAYLTEVSFGIWLTVSAVLNWFNFFDLGMGNGLRNKFAEAKAAGDIALAKTFVSTTYSLLILISAGLLVLFLIANLFIDWSVIFVAPDYLKEDVNKMVMTLAILFCPQFFLQLIKMVVTADQRPAVANLMNTLVNVLHLVALYGLSVQGSPSLFKLALAIGGINMLVPLLANVIFFSGTYRDVAPDLKSINFQYSRSLMGLGFVFFIMQGAALVVFMTDNLIITRVLGPEEVPAYNIAFRYYNLIVVFFGLVTTPFWSAFTEAYVKKDMVWIQKVLRKLFTLWLGVAVLGVVMYFVSPYVYHLWIGDEIEIPMLLNLVMMLWVLATTGLSIFGVFLSGIGKLRLSLYHSIVVMIINIPMSVWLAGYSELGSAGVMIASLFGVLLRLFFQPRQTFKLIKGTATGIWNK